jgi:hypothetical protein
MSAENNILQSVGGDLEGHLRFYVDVYRQVSEQERAHERDRLIHEDSSWWTRDPHDSARLLVCEYLDSHPQARDQAIAYVGSLPHLAQPGDLPTIGMPHPHSEMGPGDVAQEQFHRLEGGFLPALMQGVANEIWHDPAEALDRAAPFVTAMEMLEAHGDALHTSAEFAQRPGESQEHREQFIEQAGRDHVQAVINEGGGNTPASNFPHAVEEAGHDRLHSLEHTYGQAETSALIDRLHPGQVPGDSSWELGNARHPEHFTEGTDKHEGSPNPADGSDKHAATAQAPHDTGMAVPQAATAQAPHDTGMAVPQAASAQAPHDTGMAVPHAATAQAPHDTGMAVPHAATAQAPHDTGMAVPHAATAQAPHDTGMAVPHAATAQAPHDTGMAVPHAGATHTPHDPGSVPPHDPASSQPHTQDLHHQHDSNAPHHFQEHSGHGTHGAADASQAAHQTHDIGLDGAGH